MSNQTKCIERETTCKCMVMEKPMSRPKRVKKLECEPQRQIRCEPQRQVYCEPQRQVRCEPQRQRYCEPQRQNMYCEPQRQMGYESQRQDDCEPQRQWGESRSSAFDAEDKSGTESDAGSWCSFNCCQTAPRQKQTKVQKSTDCAALSEELGNRLQQCLRQKAYKGSAGRLRDNC